MVDPLPTTPALRLFKGRTAHQRFTPVEHKFSYRLFLIDLDIDRLDEASKQSRLFSVNRANLFSFRSTDHGNRRDVDLRPWADAIFADAGIDLGGGPIRLVTLARHLFYKFAPISLWFGYDNSGSVVGIIYEVNNTFGQSHCYVANVDGARSVHDADKKLYVSPFFDVTGQYRFTLRTPDDKLSLVIENMLEGKRQHMASIQARAFNATGMAFAVAAIFRPLSSFGVSMAIHFEALKLWIKKAGYRSNPGAPVTASTKAHTVPTPKPAHEKSLQQ
ncbi:MAG: DUF1365 domain-containing protein [Hyphomonadaceae bacterium]